MQNFNYLYNGYYYTFSGYMNIVRGLLANESKEIEHAKAA